MECPYCHKEIPQDSAFCYHCGKEISADALKQKNKSKLKKNPRENSWAKLGILLFFIGLQLLVFANHLHFTLFSVCSFAFLRREFETTVSLTLTL